MNRQVNSIAGRLSLRPPQRRSLEILDRVTEIAPPRRGLDPTAALAAIRSEFPTVTDFERAFPSICFALATGVGKTRLMGAFIAYLHLAHGMRTFFVLAPNLTIYDKLIADFTQGTPKYVFKGISEFAVTPPEIITGDNWENRGAHLDLFGGVAINIFNISKLNSEARGGRKLKLRSFRETLGESYFDHLAAKDDLVLIMDESHRYRGSAGWNALNELKPVLGLEVTATPFEERGARGPAPFKNVIFDYPLGKAMEDGFVKEPAVVTRKDFNPADHGAAGLSREIIWKGPSGSRPDLLSILRDRQIHRGNQHRWALPRWFAIDQVLDLVADHRDDGQSMSLENLFEERRRDRCRGPCPQIDRLGPFSSALPHQARRADSGRLLPRGPCRSFSGRPPFSLWQSCG